jgi:hypothetical protein
VYYVEEGVSFIIFDITADSIRQQTLNLEL